MLDLAEDDLLPTPAMLHDPLEPGVIRHEKLARHPPELVDESLVCHSSPTLFSCSVTERQRVSSGSPYEPRIGFSRALRVGRNVYVSRTAPIWPDGSCDPDPEIQARRCLEIIVEALAEAGAAPKHVARTRMFLTDPPYAGAVSRAQSAVLGEVGPAATMRWIAGILDSKR